MDELIKNKHIKKKKLTIIISIVSTLIILLGSVYAFFTYYKSAEAFTLTSNSITATFTEGTNQINFTGAYPISDEYALANLDKLDYIDFTVTGNSVNQSEAITYEIFLTEANGNTLSNQFIKTYVTDNNGNQMTNPATYGSLLTTTYINEPTGKIVLKRTYAKTFTKSYRLYIWLDKDYEQNEVSQTFSFYVNIYAYNDLSSNAEIDISFNANGGIVSPGLATINSGETLILPEPTREGYTFDGWYTELSEGTEVTNLTTFTSSQEIFAHWILDEIAIDSFTIAKSEIKVHETINTLQLYTGAPKTISYSSSNASVATVDENGVITGHKGGSATITITLTYYDETVEPETEIVTVTVIPLSSANVSYSPPNGVTCKSGNNNVDCDSVQLMIEKIDEMLD